MTGETGPGEHPAGTNEARLIAMIERMEREHAAKVADLTARLESRDRVIRDVLEQLDAFTAKWRMDVAAEPVGRAR